MEAIEFLELADILAIHADQISLLVFLDWNNIQFDCRPGELADLTLAVATGNCGKKEIAAFFQERSSRSPS